ncbi:hypothetical protein H2202_009529 [Exophiala xenobiotica]|nr:hypothetical protein H2202_009529 [Exophiala xenobiotica]
MTGMNQLDVDAPKNLDSHISHPASMKASPLRTSISPVTPPRPIQLPHVDSIAACNLLLQKQAQLGKLIEEIQCESHFSTRKPLCQSASWIEAVYNSVETIVGILRRFSVQHTLKNAPLIFVYGLIAAIDASLAMTPGRVPEDGPHPLPVEAVLLAMDTMLLELSHSWRIAGDARNGLRDRLQQVQMETTTPRDDKSISTPSTCTGISPDFRDYYAAEPGTIFAPCAQALPQEPLWCGNNQELDLEILGASDLEFDMSSVFQYGGGLADLRTF